MSVPTKPLSQLIDEAFMIVDDVACYAIERNGQRILRVIDLKYRKYVAEFYWDNKFGSFNVIKSTFTEGKRKYQMLYYIERNSKSIYDSLMQPESDPETGFIVFHED